jgi:hypothetical protein
LFAEEIRNTHRFIPFTIREGEPVQSPRLLVFKGRHPFFRGLAYLGTPDKVNASNKRGFEPTGCYASSSGPPLGDLMIPRLYVQGILEALNPTDEGTNGQVPKYLEGGRKGSSHAAVFFDSANLEQSIQV